MHRPRVARGFALRRGVPLLALLAALGCSSSDGLNPVSGAVFSSDGKPATGALVIFHPEGPADAKTPAASASGRVKEDGTFALMTGDKLGAKAGKYVVTVRWPDPNKKLSNVQKMMGASADDAPDVFKGRYETREKSSLRAEVKSGENKLEAFNLK